MNQARTPGKTVYLASDHAGFALKEFLKAFLKTRGLDPVDLGPGDDSPASWSEFGARGAGAVARDPEHLRGILICGSGIGMSIVANKFPRVRGALCHDVAAAVMSRRHNNANVLCLGARVISGEQAREIAGAWLDTAFDGGRHQERLNYLLERVEEKNFR